MENMKINSDRQREEEKKETDGRTEGIRRQKPTTSMYPPTGDERAVRNNINGYNQGGGGRMEEESPVTLLDMANKNQRFFLFYNFDPRKQKKDGDRKTGRRQHRSTGERVQGTRQKKGCM